MKTLLKLHLNHVEAQWAYHHLDTYKAESIHRKSLRKMLELIMEPRPDNYKEKEFHTKNHIFVKLAADVQPSQRATKWRHFWIPPAKMKVFEGMIEDLWKQEIITNCIQLTGLYRESGRKIKRIDIIRGFYQLYDINPDYLKESRIIKMVQRTEEKLESLNKKSE